jgi:hypothetical protein
MPDQTTLGTIAQPVFAPLSGAIGATKYPAAVFNAVADNLTPAMTAFRRHLLNRALEAVEDVRFFPEPDLECLVIFISAMFAFGHKRFPPCLVSLCSMLKW